MRIIKIIAISLGAIALLTIGLVVKQKYFSEKNIQMTNAENTDENESEYYSSEIFNNESKDNNSQLPIIKVAQIEHIQNSSEKTVRASGKIDTEHTSQIVAQINGTVKNIPVQIGQKVSKGQVVMDISDKQESQQLVMQQQNLREQIELQKNQIKITTDSIKQNTEFTLYAAQNNLAILQNSLSKTQIMNEKTLTSLDNDIRSLQTIVEKTQTNISAVHNNASSQKEQLFITASSTASSAAYTTWSSIKNSALPLASIVNVNSQKRLQNLAHTFENWIDDISSNTIDDDIGDIIDDLQDARDELQSLIDQSNAWSTNTLVQQYIPMVNQGLVGIIQSIGTLYTFEEQIFNVDNTISVQTTPGDISLIQLQQQLESLKQTKEKTTLQLEVQAQQIQSQINSLQSSINNAQWTLNALATNVQPELQAMNMQLNSLEQQSDDLHTQLEKQIIVAPFNGIISNISKYAGEDIVAGTPIMEIITEATIIKGFIHTSDIHYIDIGSEARISLFGEDEEFRGAVAFIYPKADEKTGNVEINIISNEPLDAIPGTLLDIDFFVEEVESKNNIVPLNAINIRTDGNVLFIYDPNTQTVHSQNVTIKNYINNFVEINENISPETFIVIDGQRFLEDGQSVSISY